MALNLDRISERAAAARFQLRLADDEVRLICRCAMRVYQEIGPSLPPENSRFGASRAAVISAVVEDGRLEREVRRRLELPSAPLLGPDPQRNNRLVVAVRNPLVIDLIGLAFGSPWYAVGPI